jgi:hypothetical protein
MDRWLLYVEAICVDHNREEEFNSWYDEVHVPDVMEASPDFVTCSRYKLISSTQGHGKYLTVIEIETEDIDRTLEIHRKNGERIRAEGRLTDLIQVVSRKLYRLEREL